MRYITILIVITVYWFLLGLGLSFLIQDEFIIASAFEGNTSYNLIDEDDINMTAMVYNSEDIEGTTLRTFPSVLKMMFGFRTPIPQGIPSIFAVLLSFTNWFALIFFGIAVYRVANPLA